MNGVAENPTKSRQLNSIKMSSTKFTLELKGIELPKSTQEEISKALNQTLMHKIGELDLAPESSEAHSNSNSPFYLNKFRIDGGEIAKLLNKDLLSQIEKELKIPKEDNFYIAKNAIH
ncbi:hypothetical protein A4H97_13730 [Niastella yeongjuensis]|uniref:Uncharacterized protein n=1 Tax=Niastella yeongjuensis TaxID=354355 RepID=A0A1V9E3L5_9BACT|nr:hypothetical protein [Niastella yeongjuensis]OQP40679.1 hypothetical protein A4H97_13730 [Niastella yeongjuensis]SEP04813.1 hypothetical protein SAMN05660816_04311 [Niastella yeongjuensis]